MMPDKENVVRNLERMLSNYDMLDDIVINKNNEMLMFHRAVAKAALELLKEQDKSRLEIASEMVKGSILMYQGKQIVRCKDCKHRGDKNKCIVAFVAAKQDFPVCFYDNHGDWFCADGEAKDQ